MPVADPLVLVGPEVMVGLPAAPVPVAEPEPELERAAVEENWTQSSEPTDCADSRSLASQESRRHGAARVAMAVWVGPQAQAWSSRAQPAAEMAEMRQVD